LNALAVSIIIPCYNEEATIRLLLEAIEKQTFPHEEIEVLISDGLSTDRTRQEITEFQTSHPGICIHLIDNDRRTIPSGLNTAIQAACGEFIVRLDAHSRPYPDYVERCINALREGKGDNIGGIWEIQPGGQNWITRSIAAAASHPLGVGDAYYRVGGEARAVDTVPFGAYRRALIDRIGHYDESLLTNEDYELNVRIRKTGGVVWLDPAIRCVYYARPDLRSLARQYFRYGYWKGKMLQRYPGTVRWRQLLPPIFTLSLIILVAGAFFIPPLAGLFLSEILIYWLAMTIAGINTALKKDDLSMIIGFPLAVATMHLSWGSALLWSLIAR
jgi:glycosyltransferase involved in cell wall biosynthesis